MLAAAARRPPPSTEHADPGSRLLVSPHFLFTPSTESCGICGAPSPPLPKPRSLPTQTPFGVQALGPLDVRASFAVR